MPISARDYDGGPVETTHETSAPPPAPTKQPFGRAPSTTGPAMSAPQIDADVEIEGSGRVTAAAIAAAVGTFLPWHAVEMPQMRLAVTGLDTGPGIAALCGAIACALLTGAERTNILPIQRNHLLVGAMLTGGLSALMYAIHWNDTRNPIFGALIGTTAWFYLAFAAAVACACFAFGRMRKA